MCEICFDLEWTIIMHLPRNRGSGTNDMSIHLNSNWRMLFLQGGYTRVVKRSNVLNIRKVEK